MFLFSILYSSCFKGLSAGPFKTLPSKSNTLPWHGHINLSFSTFNTQPKWVQEMLKTFILSFFFIIPACLSLIR